MRNSAPTTTTGARGSSSAALFPLLASLPSEGLGLGAADRRAFAARPMYGMVFA